MGLNLDGQSGRDAETAGEAGSEREAGEAKTAERSLRPRAWWATPTLLVQHPDSESLNEGLARIILQKEAEITSKRKPTSVAGQDEGLTAHWLEYNVLLWNYPECVELRRRILDGAREFIAMAGDPDDPDLKIVGISCWANVLRYGECLDIHHHDPGFISAHYTVATGRAAGDPPASRDSGHTVYYRPGFIERSHGGESAGPMGSPWDGEWRTSSTPTPGNLFFFPSYVRHEVRPNLERGPRISIAMDIYVRKQQALIHFAPPRWFVPK